MSTPLAVVFGATGAQGGSVVDHLLKDGGFAVRAVTRNPSSDAAKKLAERGVEVVKGDLDDVESLKAAVKGADFVFGLTNFWEPAHGLDPKPEIRQGKNLVDAVKTISNLKLFVWSTLEDCYVPHFRSKFLVDSYLKKTDIPHLSLYTAFYYENLTTFFPPTYSDGAFKWTIPMPTDSQIFTYSVTDTGGWVVAAFKDPSSFAGTDLKVATEFITPRELTNTFAEVTGEKVNLVEFDQAGFEKFASVVGEEIYLNMRYFVDNQADSGVRDVDQTSKVYPEAKRWKDVVKENSTFWQNLKTKGEAGKAAA